MITVTTSSVTTATERQAVWEVVPGERVGPLRLGMTEGELASAWDAIPSNLKMRQEMHADHQVTVHFGEDGGCTRICFEIAQPAPVLLSGVDLRSLNADEFEEVVSRLGRLEFGYAGVMAPTAGVGGTKWERTDESFTFVDVTTPAAETAASEPATASSASDDVESTTTKRDGP